MTYKFIWQKYHVSCFTSSLSNDNPGAGSNILRHICIRFLKMNINILSKAIYGSLFLCGCFTEQWNGKIWHCCRDPGLHLPRGAAIPGTTQLLWQGVWLVVCGGVSVWNVGWWVGYVFYISSMNLIHLFNRFYCVQDIFLFIFMTCLAKKSVISDFYNLCLPLVGVCFNGKCNFDGTCTHANGEL